MTKLVAEQSNIWDNQFPHLGLSFTNSPYNGWYVFASDTKSITIHVWYWGIPQVFPTSITFHSSSGFTYNAGAIFPTGIVSKIEIGTIAHHYIPADPDNNATFTQIAALGLSVADIVEDPSRLFTGDDVLTSTGDFTNGDYFQAGDGDDIVTGSFVDGVFDMGRGGGSVDGGRGVDLALMDFSDRSQGVDYTHSKTEAHVTIDGQTELVVKRIERVEIIGGLGYDRLVGGVLDDVLDVYRGGGSADGGDGVDTGGADLSDQTRSVVYEHSDVSANVLVGGSTVATFSNVERVVITGGSAADRLTGGILSDTLRGGLGDDTLSGGDGDDLLRGGAGDDRLDGGAGSDTIELRGDVDLTVDLSIATAQNTGDGFDTLISIESVMGGAGDDVLVGNDDFNRLHGGDGDDYLAGGGGGDQLVGGFGDNVMLGGDGHDEIFVHIGNPFMMYEWSGDGSNNISGGDGNDRITGGNGPDVIRGDAGNDYIFAYAGPGLLYGGSGNDQVQGGNETDHIEGGSGTDYLIGGWGSDWISGGSGADEIVGDMTQEAPSGSTPANDVLIGGSGSDGLGGGMGDDILRGGSGNNRIYGGDGFDIADYSDATVGITVSTYSKWDVRGGGYTKQNTGFSKDRLDSIEGLIGSAFNDHLTGRDDGFSEAQLGWTFGEYFNGGAGDDLIDGRNGNDEIIGGAGDDTLRGGTGDDLLTGGAGLDTLAGGKGNDYYNVDSDTDVLIEAKGEGVDTVISSVSFVLRAGVYIENLTLTGSANLNGAGNGLDNTLAGNDGLNTLAGGKGNDTYVVQNTGDVLVEAKNEGVDTAISSVSFALMAGSYVENLTLTGSADINATGNGLNNILTGNSGINTLSGGRGNDTYIVQNTGDVLVEAKSEGTDIAFSSVTFTLAAGVYVEHLTLTGLADINGTGNGLNNILTGNAGKNVLTGAKGDDTYYVQNSGDVAVESKDEGTDTVISSVSYSLKGQYIETLTLTGSESIYAKGNTLDNQLTGNAGANKLNGMQGQDRLTGGGGSDTFIWDATSHSTVSKSDRVTDLSNSDFIDLSRIDADTTTAGTQHLTLVDAFTNTAGQVALSYNAGTNITSLNADTNGDGVSDMLIRIDGDHTDFDNFIFGG